MADDYLIHLNFLAVDGDIPSFVVHRKHRDPAGSDRPDGTVSAYKLPHAERDDEQWSSYWVSPVSLPGFESFEVGSDWNNDLTRWFLFLGLRQSVTTRLSAEEYAVPDKDFIEELSLPIVRHKEGAETLVVQPYFLKSERRFGLLADFRFKMAADVQFDRRVQQLSLSLDRNGRRNLDYYVDRVAKIKQFVDHRWTALSPIRMPGAAQDVTFRKELHPMRAERLRSKVYVFSGDRESKSQFSGLKQYGPLQGVGGTTKLLFVFREQDRHAARTLAVALRGAKSKGSFAFPGFQALFKTDLDIDHDPVVVSDFSESELQRALERAKEERKTHERIVPVIVLPEDDDEGYLRQKAMFVHSELPTQVCTLRVLRDPELLKWAVAGLALQIFCKAGGQPWKVRPTPAERSLILGISQSHKYKPEGERFTVEKYFAFSVLTDSSGLFHDIQVLGESEDQADYLAKLRTSLGKILAQSADAFGRVVVHTSFKLKHREMRAIEETVKQTAASTTKCRFAVVKVNHKSRFFGINRSVNSLVPFEATQVRLGAGEYLVWFEGILPGNPTVNKAFPGPTHLQFLRVNEDQPISADVLLQDLVNLSGANWRGFNAKSAPVSVFYCHLVADLVHDFHDRGLPMPAVKDIRPWFL